MELANMLEIRELYDAHDANEYMKAGWVLLHIGQYSSDNGEACTAYVVRTVGWPKGQGEVKEPNLDKDTIL